MLTLAKSKRARPVVNVGAASRARFQLPAAPLAFRKVTWEVEFSPLGIKNLAMLHDGEFDNADAPVIAPEYKSRFKTLRRQLLDRLKGGREDIDWTEFDLGDTGKFHQRVWQAMLRIPFGETATYAEIASDAGSPLAFAPAVKPAAQTESLSSSHATASSHRRDWGGFGCGLEWKKHFLAMEQC